MAIAAHYTLLHARLAAIAAAEGRIYDCEIHKDAPYAYYKLDEKSGNTAVDSSGNLRHGTYELAVNPIESMHIGSHGGQTFIGSGSNAGIDVGFTTNGFTQLTIDFWVSTFDNTGGFFQRIFGNINNIIPGGVIDLRSPPDGNSVTLAISGLGDVTTTVTPGEVNHLVFTWDSTGDGKARVYKNGILDGTSTGSRTTPLDDTTLHHLGSIKEYPDAGNIEPFLGKIDSFTLFDTALPEERILEHYKAGTVYGVDNRTATIAEDCRGTVSKSAYDDGVLALGPHAYFKLNDTGATAFDASSNAYNGTYAGTHFQIRNPLRFGSEYSVKFDGGQVDLNEPNFDIDGDISVEAWIQTTTADTTRHIYSKFDNGANAGVKLTIDYAGRVEFLGKSGNPVTYSSGYSPAANDGKPHHVVGVRAGSIWKIYLDGVLASFSDSGDTGSILNNSQPMIGNDPISAAFSGNIDSVAVYDFALSDAQVLSNYNNGQSPYEKKIKELSPYVYYKLDEVSGTTAIDSSGTGADATYAGTFSLDNRGLFLGSNRSIDTDGISGEVTRANFSSSFPITITAWVSLDSGGSVSIATHDTDDIYNGIWVDMYESLNSVRVVYGDGGGRMPNNHFNLNHIFEFEVGKSYHLVAVIRGFNDADVYLNGVLLPQSSTSGTATFVDMAPAGNFTINRLSGASPDNFHSCNISHVAIFHSELVAEDITELYEAGKFECSTYDDLMFSQKPYGFWKLDAASGSVATDYSGNGRNGTYLETVRQRSPVAYNSSNSQTFVDNGSNSGIDLGFKVNGWTAVTYSAWIQSNTTGRIINDSVGGVTPGNFRFALLGNGELHFMLSTGSGADPVNKYNFSTTRKLTDGAVYHVAATWDKNGDKIPRIYVNGKLDTSGNAWDFIPDRTDLNVRIGARSDNGAPQSFVGRIDDAAIWDRALTAEEIRLQYEMGKTIHSVDRADDAQVNEALYATTVGMWRLNEETGTTALDSTGLSGNGTIGGSPDRVAPITHGSDYALLFDGVDNYVDIFPSSGLAPVSTDESWSIWFRVDDLTPPNLLYGRNASNGDNKILVGLNADGSFTFLNISPQYLSAPGVIEEHKVYHMAFSIERSNNLVRCFLNGEELISGAFPISLTAVASASTDSITLGAEYDAAVLGDWFKGVIADFVIFDGILTETDAKAIYEAGRIRNISKYDSEVRALCPYAYYTLNDRTGETEAVDDSGNFRHGTYGSPALPVEPIVTGSESSQTFIDVGENTGLNAGFSINGFTAFTFAAWFNTPSTGAAQAFCQDVESGLNVGNISSGINGSGIVYFDITDEGNGVVGHTTYPVASPHRVDDGKDHFFVGVWDGNNSYIYIDGALVNSVATPDTQLDCTQLLRIGGRNSDPGENAYFPFTGKLDSVVIDNKAWTADQIESLYCLGKEMPAQKKAMFDCLVYEDNPYAYYRLNEFSGNAAADSSGNKRHGTYQETVRNTNPLTIGSDRSQTFIDNGEASGITTPIAFNGFTKVTVAFWAKIPSSGIGGSIIRDVESGQHVGGIQIGYNASGYFWMQLISNGDSPSAPPAVVNQVSTPSNYGPDEEHFVVATWENNKPQKIYVDGVLVAESGNVSATVNNTGNVWIGARNSDPGENAYSIWTGSLDSLAIFDKVLSADRISEMYDKSVPWDTDPRVSSSYRFKLNELHAYSYHLFDTSLKIDDSGNDRSLSVVGSVDRPETPLLHGSTNSVLFDAAGEYLQGADADFDIDGDITVGAWILSSVPPPVNAQSSLVTKYHSDDDAGWWLRTEGAGYARFSGRSGSGSWYSSGLSSTIVHDGLPHFIVGVRQSGVWKIYVDGALESEINSGNTGSILNNRPVYINYHEQLPTEYFDGNIDGVCIFDRALTDSEIESLYCSGKAWDTDPEAPVPFVPESSGFAQHGNIIVDGFSSRGYPVTLNGGATRHIALYNVDILSGYSAFSGYDAGTDVTVELHSLFYSSPRKNYIISVDSWAPDISSTNSTTHGTSQYVPGTFPVPNTGNELHVGSGQTYAKLIDAYNAAVDGDDIIVHPGTHNCDEFRTGAGGQIWYKNVRVYGSTENPNDVVLHGNVSSEQYMWWDLNVIQTIEDGRKPGFYHVKLTRNSSDWRHTLGHWFP